MNISVIIPVYNGESYYGNFQNNLESFLESFGEDSEIILVNDGSTDSTHELFSGILNISYLKKINGGVSSSRNYGLKYAKNDFVVFLDIDDIIDFRILKKNLTNNEIQFSNYRIDGVVNEKYRNVESMSSPIFLEEFLRRKIKFHLGSFIFKKSFLIENSIKFDDQAMYGEDLKFIFQCLLSSNNISLNSEPYFNYILTSNSNSSAMNSPIGLKKLKFIDDLDQFVLANKKFNFFKFCVCLSLIKYSLKYGCTDRFVKKELFNKTCSSFLKFIKSEI